MEKNTNIGFVVMGVRHFMNGEHHWIAPSADADGFAHDGKVTENDYYKPVFESMKDAENYAMSFLRDEYTLAEYEERRPTMYVLEEPAYRAIVERDNYSLPKEAEAWSDAKVSDFEWETDCEDIKNLAIWDSDSDEERVGERILEIARHIDYIEGLSAWVDCDRIAVSPTMPMNKESVADFIESVEGFPYDEVRWVASDESANIAWYKVR